MDDLKARLNASCDHARSIVRFAASGLFDEQELKDGAAEIAAAAAPMIRAQRPWSVLADYSEAIVQPRNVAGSITDSFEAGRKLGLKRIAIVNAPALVQMQYKRLVGMIDVEYFDSKIDALAWLDEQSAKD